MSEFILQATRDAQDAGRCIRTYTGKYVNPLAMREEDIDIRDIAHHLANECRYMGACPEHYSVAQHSVLVSRYFAEPDGQLLGLLHDAAEAYLKDIPSPVKHDPRMAWYQDIEHRLTEMIFGVFGLPRTFPPTLKDVDNEVFRREVESFWGKRFMPIDVVPWSPRTAEANFLVAFEECTHNGKVKA